MHKPGFWTHAGNGVLQCGEAGNVLTVHSISDTVWLCGLGWPRICNAPLPTSVGITGAAATCRFVFFQVGAHVAQATHYLAEDDLEPLLLCCLTYQVPGLDPGAATVALKLIFNSPKSVQLVLWYPRGLGTEPPTSPLR